MPSFNDCSVYDEKCRNNTCTHPTATHNQRGGIRCRTMISRRPCGNARCIREDCSTVSVKPLAKRTEFSIEDLRLISAMCLTVNPWYPERDMMDSFASVYFKANLAIKELEK